MVRKDGFLFLLLIKHKIDANQRTMTKKSRIFLKDNQVAA